MDSSPTEESEVHPEWAGEGADSASGAASNLSRILVTAPEMASRGSRKVSASALIESGGGWMDHFGLEVLSFAGFLSDVCSSKFDEQLETTDRCRKQPNSNNNNNHSGQINFLQKRIFLLY